MATDDEVREALAHLNRRIQEDGGPRPDWVRERDSEAERWGDDCSDSAAIQGKRHREKERTTTMTTESQGTGH